MFFTIMYAHGIMPSFIYFSFDYRYIAIIIIAISLLIVLNYYGGSF